MTVTRAELKGMTVRDCPAICTPEHCIISTVNVCKHPCLSGDAGCGPITMANREVAKKFVKISQIEGGGDAEREPSTARVRGNVEDGGRATKASRPRKKANARKRRQRVPKGGQGSEDRSAGEAREEEVTNS